LLISQIQMTIYSCPSKQFAVGKKFTHKYYFYNDSCNQIQYDSYPDPSLYGYNETTVKCYSGCAIAYTSINNDYVLKKYTCADSDHVDLGQRVYPIYDDSRCTTQTGTLYDFAGTNDDLTKFESQYKLPDPELDFHSCQTNVQLTAKCKCGNAIVDPNSGVCSSDNQLVPYCGVG